MSALAWFAVPLLFYGFGVVAASSAVMMGEDPRGLLKWGLSFAALGAVGIVAYSLARWWPR